ncbi:hypothetical protein N3K66_003859 [Trichothecium roseum]|uniref:Uncharacterized protein n=1 Tax=Trichothecium roseum TaxID=47278 RepID=A0ACC0V8E3_9HYPO|nr:hypothetical protein N3K66_003859 [Trichothecium roseum]
MSSKIVIIGCGFAGVWSAFAAQRLINLKGKQQDVEVIIVAPESVLVPRPRLYEANAATMVQPLGGLFESTGIRFVPGFVDTIHHEHHNILVRSAAGTMSTIGYDRLILAAGSSIIHPESVNGIEEYAFNIDNIESATKLQGHIDSLVSEPPSPARDTVVVCGAGFTGIELATELPKRLSVAFGDSDAPRVVLVGNSAEVGPELGPGPRPVILEALKELGVECKLGSAVASIDPDGVTLASGERIESKTAIWTAGVHATPLTQQIPAPKDKLGRLYVGENLQVPQVEDIFATGDAACAATDADGHYAMMSCQHALPLGRSSGHNAAADLLGEPSLPYSQVAYLTCLDLGPWGAVVTQGWDRKVLLTGDIAKRAKTYINQTLIYAPKDGQTALETAYPEFGKSDELFAEIMGKIA